VTDIDTTADTASTAGDPPARLVSEVEALGQRMAAVKDNIGKVIFGQHDVIDQTLITILAGGHALLVGYPGLGN
jgi:MoxR-like ATPase